MAKNTAPTLTIKSDMRLNAQMLATPVRLLDRLTPIPNKTLPRDFSAAVKRLTRPYFRLNDHDYQSVRAKSGNSDVLLFDGKTQVTFGEADGGWALMPLKDPL